MRLSRQRCVKHSPWLFISYGGYSHILVSYDMLRSEGQGSPYPKFPRILLTGHELWTLDESASNFLNTRPIFALFENPVEVTLYAISYLVILVEGIPEQSDQL